jgi:hypothetical protein
MFYQTTKTLYGDSRYCSFKFDNGRGGPHFSPVYRSLNSEPAAMEDLVEDFNFPGINWQTRLATSRRDKLFLQACQDANLNQLADFPTPVRGNTLDLLLTNVPERVVEPREVGGLGRSD